MQWLTCRDRHVVIDMQWSTCSDQQAVINKWWSTCGDWHTLSYSHTVIQSYCHTVIDMRWLTCSYQQAVIDRQSLLTCGDLHAVIDMRWSTCQSCRLFSVTRNSAPYRALFSSSCGGPVDLVAPLEGLRPSCLFLGHQKNLAPTLPLRKVKYLLWHNCFPKPCPYLAPEKSEIRMRSRSRSPGAQGHRLAPVAPSHMGSKQDFISLGWRTNGRRTAGVLVFSPTWSRNFQSVEFFPISDISEITKLEGNPSNSQKNLKYMKPFTTQLKQAGKAGRKSKHLRRSCS